MRFHKIITLILLVLFLASFVMEVASAHQRSWPGKRLAQVIPEATGFISRQVTLSSEQTAAVEKSLGEPLKLEDKSPIFYFAQKQTDGKTERIGTVLFVDAIGEKGAMEVGVGIDKKGQVVRVVIFEHREDARIGDEFFLKQFVGKTYGAPFLVGKDIQGIEGSEITIQALATGIRKALLITQEVFGKR